MRNYSYRFRSMLALVALLFGMEGSGMMPGEMMFFVGTGTKLPYDAEVEYLESTGTQYIDTGVYGTQDVIATFRACNLTNRRNTDWGFGARVAWGMNMFCVYNGSDQSYRYVFGWGNGQDTSAAISSVSSTTGAMVDFVISNRCSVDGHTLPKWSYMHFSTPYTLLMFAANLNGSIAYGMWRFSNVRITDESVLFFDSIPVRFTNELGQTEGAMYDRVSGKLFRNQGSGSFLIGPDK